MPCPNPQPVNHCLHIPTKNEHIDMCVNDTLEIHIEGDCSWCHHGASACFSGGFLPGGDKHNGDNGGIWTATAAGTVGFDAVHPGQTCHSSLTAKHGESHDHPLVPAHTITVS